MRTTQPAIDTAQIKPKMGTDPSLSSDIEEGFMAGVKNLAQTYYNAILSENIQLKDTLQKAQEDNKDLKEIIGDQQLTIQKLEKKISVMEGQLKEPKSLTCQKNPPPDYLDSLDATHFHEDATPDDIQKLSDVLLSMVDVLIENKTRLIENKTDVTYVYKLLTSDNPRFNKKYGFYGPVPSFCHYWNKAVAERIKDETLRKGLTLDNPDSFRTMTNKGICRQNPISWRRLYDKANRDKASISKALNIKFQLEKNFKPAI